MAFTRKIIGGATLIALAIVVRKLVRAKTRRSRVGTGAPTGRFTDHPDPLGHDESPLAQVEPDVDPLFKPEELPGPEVL